MNRNDTCSFQIKNIEYRLHVTDQLHEVISHPFVVLVDCVNDSIYEGLLIPLAQLCHIAEINIAYSAISQGKDVARVGVTMEKAKLQLHEY